MSKQECKQGGVNQGLGNVLFNQPPVVQHSKNGNEINQPVQLLPAFTAQFLHHRIAGSHSQRQKQNKCSKADGDKRPFDDIPNHGVKIEKLVQPDIGNKV